MTSPTAADVLAGIRSRYPAIIYERTLLTSQNVEAQCEQCQERPAVVDCYWRCTDSGEEGQPYLCRECDEAQEDVPRLISAVEAVLALCDLYGGDPRICVISPAMIRNAVADALTPTTDREPADDR